MKRQRHGPAEEVLGEVVDEVRRLRSENERLRDDLAWASRQYDLLAEYLDLRVQDEADPSYPHHRTGRRITVSTIISVRALASPERELVVAGVMERLADLLCAALAHERPRGRVYPLKGRRFVGPPSAERVARWARIVKQGDKES